MQLSNLLTIALAGLAAASPVELVERQQKLRISAWTPLLPLFSPSLFD